MKGLNRNMSKQEGDVTDFGVPFTSTEAHVRCDGKTSRVDMGKPWLVDLA